MDRSINFVEERGFRVVAPLAGDASLRRFFRLERGGRSYVLMLYPEPIDPSLDLLQVYPYLSCLLPLPRILDVWFREGGVLLEDAGDESLEMRPEPAIYRRLVELHLVLVKWGATVFPPDHLVFRRALDRERFLRELNFTGQQFLARYLGCRLDLKEWERACREFLQTIEYRMVLNHRDYHARNVFVKDGRIFIIDYQDTMLGPAGYDLVSLTRDCYVVLEDDFRKELEERFLQETGTDPLQLELVSLQRHLKALGTFGFQIKERGKLYFEEYIPNGLKYVRKEMEKLRGLPGLERLRALLVNCKIL